MGRSQPVSLKISRFVSEQATAAASSANSTEPSLPVWLLPQVLSLDAPTVALVWQWFFAKSFHVRVGSAVLFVTAACVWMIYAADHLLDVRSGAIYSSRHRFLAKHQRTIWAVAVIVFGSASVVSWGFPLSLWLGALELTAIVGVYLGIVHLLGAMTHRYWPKEFAIGVVFAAGSSIATWTQTGRDAWPEILLFAGLCSLNCCAVDYWEWQADGILLRYPHWMTRLVARHFVACAAGLMGAAALVFAFHHTAVPVAVIACVLLLIALNGGRHSLSSELARLLADAALLTPLFFLLR